MPVARLDALDIIAESMFQEVRYQLHLRFARRRFLRVLGART